jgi:Eukaryotic aspartyl protease
MFPFLVDAWLDFTSIRVDNAMTVFENAIQQNVVDEPIFSFYLGNNAPGELTFRGYDASKFTGDLILSSIFEQPIFCCCCESFGY